MIKVVITYLKSMIKIYIQLSLRLRTPGVGPCRFSVIYRNYTLCKTYTSLRRTTDIFETVNRQLEGALCSKKYLKTVM